MPPANTRCADPGVTLNIERRGEQERQSNQLERQCLRGLGDSTSRSRTAGRSKLRPVGVTQRAARLRSSSADVATNTALPMRTAITCLPKAAMNPAMTAKPSGALRSQSSVKGRCPLSNDWAIKMKVLSSQSITYSATKGRRLSTTVVTMRNVDNDECTARRRSASLSRLRSSIRSVPIQSRAGLRYIAQPSGSQQSHPVLGDALICKIHARLLPVRSVMRVNNHRTG